MKTDLVILGLIENNVQSGYDIMKQLKKLTVKNANIKFGSIYHALKKSTDNGWIKKTGSTRDGGNPEKHIYKITPEGKKYLKKASKKYFSDKDVFFDADLTLMVLDELDAESIEERIQIVKDKLAMIKGTDTLYLSYIEHHLKAELAWLKAI
ncbi:MAG: PadR family transcriptional regulator [Spirochaetes bacterium]|nr:PadR family transcriptional regulator [Spirochaetota bacterium]